MKNSVMLLLAIVLVMALSFGVSEVQALTISLDPNDWILYTGDRPGVNNVDWSKTATSEGHLKATTAIPHPGTNKGVSLRTQDTFNFQDSVFKYKWKADGGTGGWNNYAGYSFNIQNDPDLAFGFWGFGGGFSTHHSYGPSTLIDSDRWIYTQAYINDDLTYSYTLSYDGYGGTDLISSKAGTFTQERYDALANMYVRHNVADNYGYNAYFEVAEAVIEYNGPDPVPEPSTMFLLGIGLIGLVGFTRKLKK